MKPQSYKRIVAYVLDIIIVTFLSTLLTWFMPEENKAYNKDLEKYTGLITDYTNKNISQEDFLENTNEILYQMNKKSIPITIVTTVLTIGYFVVFAYFMNGQTLGKKIMNLQIVSSNNKKLTINNFLIRGLVINSILMNILGIIIIIFLNKNMYIKINDIITYMFGGIYLITFGMILFREDRRGLHDYIANTKVIAIKNELVDNFSQEPKKDEDSKLKDAEIIGEKKLKM